MMDELHRLNALKLKPLFWALFLPLCLAILAVLLIRNAQAETIIAGPTEEGGPVEVFLIPFTNLGTDPTDITNSGMAGDHRLFLVQQNGKIRIAWPDGTLEQTAFLDITDRVASGGEMGLLGLVFDPDYTSNGYFYVNYTTFVSAQRYTRVSRFSVTGNPNVADPASELILLAVQQPQSNHNAGDLNFGPDGYLYIPLGDGGGSGDPTESSQDPQKLLGKMLRIDVSGTTTSSNYLIPPDNPFVSDPGVLDEIWSLGLRNPWRFSFDRLTGDMYIADVGQNQWEEIDLQLSSSSGGENWGWDCFEGNAVYEPAGCSAPGDYDFPIHVYPHSQGCSITGGFVYRGTSYPEWQGRYFFADYCFGTIWTLRTNGQVVVEEAGSIVGNITTFGEDIDGELYLANRDDDVIYRLSAYEPVSADFTATPTSGTAPLEVDFINLSTGDFDTCLWDFGDGGTSPLCGDPSYEFTSPGSYTVTLSVSGAGGSDVREAVGYISVYSHTVYLPLVIGLPGRDLDASSPH